MVFLKEYRAKWLADAKNIDYCLALRSLEVDLDKRFARIKKSEARIAIVQLEDRFKLEEEVAKKVYLTSRDEDLSPFNAILALRFKEKFGGWQTFRIKDQGKGVVPPSGTITHKNGHDYLIGGRFFCKNCENDHVAVKGLDARLEPYHGLMASVYPTPNNWMQLGYVMGNVGFPDIGLTVASYGEPLRTDKYGPLDVLMASCDVEGYNKPPVIGMGIVVL
ncbi:MAG: hypothetical protein WCV90_07790 [Candidatus Woesearchaeota archaeon]